MIFDPFFISFFVLFSVPLILRTLSAGICLKVGSTCGGWGIEAQRHHKRIATLIAEKKNESYADVISYIRTRLRFCVLDSVLTAVRGVRGKTRPGAPISTLDFNLIEH